MSYETQIAVIQTIVKEVQKDMECLVTRAEFEPVKSLVYGMVGIILVSVVGALITLVIRQ